MQRRRRTPVPARKPALQDDHVDIVVEHVDRYYVDRYYVDRHYVDRHYLDRHYLDRHYVDRYLVDRYHLDRQYHRAVAPAERGGRGDPPAARSL